MHYIKRLYLTLLELIMVLTILGIIAGFFGINIAKALKEQRFNTEVSLVLNQLRLAQDIMLIMNTNLTLTFKAHSTEGIEYSLKTAVEMPKEMKFWEKEIKRSHSFLKTIKQVNFDDQLDKDNPTDAENTISVKFLSGGDKMSYGIMRLSTSKNDEDFGALTRYICLPGYPAPIVTTSERPTEETCLGGDESFSEQMTRRTYEELRNAKTE
jgi:type II secretory pathway pseudopilin PulG